MKTAGKVAVHLAKSLQEQISSGELVVGQYFPGLQELGRKHRVSPETVRRAMKLLESQYLVCGCRGHGFRVTARSVDPNRAAPVGFVLSGSQALGQWSGLYRRMLGALHEAAGARGWSVLGVGAEGRSVAEVEEQLKFARVSGLLLDTLNRPLLQAMSRLGMPMVLVEAPGGGEAGLDSVRQDDFGGALEAAAHLVRAGHRRVGWFGPLAANPQSRERWGGAAAGLREGGASLAPENTVNSYEPAAAERLRAMLARKDRPTAVLSLWWDEAVKVARAAAELGLGPADAPEIVSWCPEEQYADFLSALPGGPAPAAVVWSMRQMAEAALDRLAERRARPGMPAVRISIGTELHLPQAQPGNDGSR